jgi:hypothetical protein
MSHLCIVHAVWITFEARISPPRQEAQALSPALCESPGESNSLLNLGLGRNDFFAFVVATRSANMVRSNKRIAIGALDRSLRLEEIVRTTHVTLGARSSLLRGRHNDSGCYEIRKIENLYYGFPKSTIN